MSLFWHKNEWMDGWVITVLYCTSSHFGKNKREAYCWAVNGTIGEEADCWQQSDCNPSFSKKSSHCVPPKEKKAFVIEKMVAVKISWLISLSSVKIGLFWCWQFNNGLCLCVSLANFSCAAGYDICARRAGMEGVSYKWGKDVIFWYFFFLSLCPRELFFFFFNCVASATSVGSVDYLGGLFHPCFGLFPFPWWEMLKWKQIMSYGLSCSRHP